MQHQNTTSAPAELVSGLPSTKSVDGLGAPLRPVYYEDNNDVSYLGYAEEDDRDERETVTAEVELYERRDDELLDAVPCKAHELDDRDGAATTPQCRPGTPSKCLATPAGDAAAERPVALVAPRRRRHNPYIRRVMPDWAYVYTGLSYTEPEAPETVVGAPADVGSALMKDVEDDLGQTPAAAMHSTQPTMDVEALEGYSANYYQNEAYAYNSWQGGYSAPVQLQPKDGKSSAAGVMCCYWKRGNCTKGAACWYSHEGSDDTPCHYGAACRKGHRHLVRAHPEIPAVATEGVAVEAAEDAGEQSLEAKPQMPEGSSDKVNEAEGVEDAAAYTSQEEYMQSNMMSQFGYPPRRYVHEPKVPRPSAPLMEVQSSCPHCEAQGTLRTQQCPLYDGPRVRQATRAHCTACQRTFML